MRDTVQLKYYCLAVLLMLACYNVNWTVGDRSGRYVSRVLYKGAQNAPESCPKGSYRATGSTVGECQLCPRGYYGSTTGLKSAACSGPCPKGHYNDKLGATSVDDCLKCPAGVYGSTTGLTSRACTSPCPLGTYSNTKGLERENQCVACAPNYRGAQGLRGNDVHGRHSGGYMCDRFHNDKKVETGRDEHRMSELIHDV